MESSKKDLLKKQAKFRALRAENRAKSAEISSARWKAHEEWAANRPENFGGRKADEVPDPEAEWLSEGSEWLGEVLDDIERRLRAME